VRKGGVAETEEADWSAAERDLLDSALEFYGAAEGVIDYSGEARPRLRYDLERLGEVRDAMAALEERIVQASEAGVSPERITSITRLDREIVDLILVRHRERTAQDPARG
jgi:hypothetical protein